MVDEVTVKWGSLLNDEWTFQGRTFRNGSAGQVYGNIIYIAEKRNPFDLDQLILLAHELAHVRQYRRLGNLDNYCREYMTEYAKVGYENNEFEQEANFVEKEFLWTLEDFFYDYQGQKHTINHQGSSYDLPKELPTGYEPTQAEINEGCTKEALAKLGAETCVEARQILDLF